MIAKREEIITSVLSPSFYRDVRSSRILGHMRVWSLEDIKWHPIYVGFGRDYI